MEEEHIDVVNEVASALEDYAERRITADEMDLRIHDKRYHRRGYKEGDTCKYRNGEAIVGSEQIQTYYENSKGKKSTECIMASLISDYSILPEYAADAEELLTVFHFTHADALNLQEKGEATTQEVFLRNTREFYKVVYDLKERYQDIPICPSRLISWKFKNYDAESSLDERYANRTTYIALGDIFETNPHPSPYHVIRHEIGHNLSTWEIGRRWRELKLQFHCKADFEKEVRRISDYALHNDEEAIAEAFATYTDPFYAKGRMHELIEMFVDDILKGNAKEGKGTSMDASENNHRDGIEPLEEVYCISVDNFSPPPDGIVWFDNKRGYVKFKTHAEMLRYGLTCYKVPETWIDKILEEFPDREWDSMDIYDIQFEYRETNKTLQDVVKHFRGWWA